MSFGKTAAALINDREMPPEDAKQPTDEDRVLFAQWYQDKFVNSLEAHPGFFRSRRFSAEEYRNTLQTLFGFDLEVQIIEAQQTVVERSLVMKLLPTDPPGKSGFTNDTHRKPSDHSDMESVFVFNGYRPRSMVWGAES